MKQLSKKTHAMATMTSTLNNGKAKFFTLLHERMEEKGDFPALSKSVRDFCKTTQDENFNVADITGIILSDFALTQKVIRLANSVTYSSIGEEITTISKAAMVIGFEALTYLVLSVRLMDTLSISASDSAVTRAEMTQALLAGDIARKIAAKTRLKNAEEAVVCTLMHHLGRLLLVFYFPEEWSRIEKVSADRSLSQNDTALKIIGVTLDEISQEVAKIWCLPQKIASSMMSPSSVVETNLPGSPGWLRMMANFAGEAAATVTKNGADDGLQEITSLYSSALLIPVATMTESVNLAINDARESIILKAVSASHGKPADSIKQLTAGVQETTAALAKGENFGSMLNLVLETLYGSMGFNRVAAFLRDGKAFKGRVGFGNAMPEVLTNLSFPVIYTADVFHLALHNNEDVFIGDGTGPTVVSMPSWLTETLPDVRAFILLPMSLNGRPIGLLYGDFRKGTKEMVEEEEMVLMRSLRDGLMQSLSSK
ncbi:MAG: HDOD domain-containing protein [Nitrosospira sp.]|nr:HDOD domain-containing protein [Nitrosospira sp.]